MDNKCVVIKPPGLWELVAPALGNEYKGHLRVQGTGFTTQDTAVARVGVTGHHDLPRELGDKGSEENAGAVGPVFSSQTCSVISTWRHRRPTHCLGHKPSSHLSPPPPPPTANPPLNSARHIQTWAWTRRLAASSWPGHRPLCS